jgi:hypothetical protein
MGLAIKVIIIVILLLGLAALLLNACTIYATRSILTPYEAHFDTSLPGRTITENGLNADFFCKDSGSPQKAVIILGGSEGGKHWSVNTPYIQQLLDQSYCVMVLAYFRAPGLPDTLREIPLEYFEKAFRSTTNTFPMITLTAGAGLRPVGPGWLVSWESISSDPLFKY